VPGLDPGRIVHNRGDGPEPRRGWPKKLPDGVTADRVLLTGGKDSAKTNKRAYGSAWCNRLTKLINRAPGKNDNRKGYERRCWRTLGTYLGVRKVWQGTSKEKLPPLKTDMVETALLEKLYEPSRSAEWTTHIPEAPPDIPVDRLPDLFSQLPIELKDMIGAYLPEDCFLDRRLNPFAREMVRRRLRMRPGPIRYKMRAPAPEPKADFDFDVDILKPTAFVAAGRRVHDSRARMDRLDPDEDGYDSKVEAELDVQRRNLARAFREFVRSIGLQPGRDIAFNKKDADQALRSALGTSETPETGRFVMPGIRPLKMADPLDAARAFSIYIARKAYTANDPRDLAAASCPLS